MIAKAFPNCNSIKIWCPHLLRLLPADCKRISSKCFSTSTLKYSSSGSVPLSFTEYGQSPASAQSHATPTHLSPVLMTHGLLGSKQNWNSIAKAVARQTGRKVVTFDARNHGDSPHAEKMEYEIMVQDVLQLANDLHLPKFVFLGHSMGGRTTAATALKHSDRLSAAVVVDISPLNLGGDFEEMKLYLETMMGINFNPAWTLSEARKEADLRLKPVVKVPEIRAFLLTNLAKTDERIFWKPNLPILLSSLNEIKRFPDHILQSTSSIPCLFIRGQNSSYVPDSDFDGIRKLFPHAEFATIKNSGHWPQADSPVDFIQVLVTFLKECP